MSLNDYLQSSIGRKQIVATTGLALILFLISHLAGNLLIYGGPEIFNGYSAKLHSLGLFLNAVEIVLLLIFIIHIWVTALLVLDNIRARGGSYAVSRSVGDRSWATRLMPYTGTYILAFVIWHLIDFTFVDHNGPRSMIHGKDYALFGLVCNSFKDPVHSLLYIIAMFAVGFHLAHGVESFCQTFGWNHPRYVPLVKRFSQVFAWGIALGFSSIPVYVLLNNTY